MRKEELSNEEEPQRQRFDVVITWSPGTEERIGLDEIEVALNDAVTTVDQEATVEVTEILEPTF